ncbi:hypothetical protein [Bacillus cereus]|uniref:hypothetical protein n=1 Tax=Bacillus cereus TaxID=1396 RepID=UPI001879AB00|nr:hypothetical protein [Bacillus cereus]MBE7123672.1 hypothetical protein [Bacillus cereus]
MLSIMLLDREYRHHLQLPYKTYIETYTNRISPVFDNIDEEAKEKAEEAHRQMTAHLIPEYCDPSEYADDAWQYGIEYYENISLMQYITKLMWISTMYQFWEQQLRKFLYKELTRNGYIYAAKNNKEIEYKDFCTNIGKIKHFFLEFKVDLTSLQCWEKLEELRLLANVIKHGDGGSATSLMNTRPRIFNSAHVSGNLLERYKTTLNDKVLDVNEQDIKDYADAIIDFWEQLPERMVANLPK